MSDRPLWRWWLFLLALRFRHYDLAGWCVLPAWLGVCSGDGRGCGGCHACLPQEPDAEVPF